MEREQAIKFMRDLLKLMVEKKGLIYLLPSVSASDEGSG